MFVTYLQNSSSTGSVPQGPWSSVLYVDNVRGNDVTAQRGNDNLPFATIQAAINAMLTGDLVQLAPQLFTLTAALTVPASVVRFCMSGYPGSVLGSTGTPSPATAIRQTTAATSCIDLGANLGLKECALRNIAWYNNGTTAAIAADGSAYTAGAFLNPGLYVINCETVSLAVKYALIVDVRGGTGTNASPFSLTGVFGGRFFGVSAAGASLIWNYDITNAHNLASPGQLTLRNGTIIGGALNNTYVTLSGQARLTVDESSTTGGLLGAGLAVSGVSVPTISHCGYVGGSISVGIDFASAGAELPDTATAITVDFRGARLYAATANSSTSNVAGIITAKFKVAGATPSNFQTVKFDSTTALPATTFIAGQKIHLTARGASWPGAVLVTPDADGDIIPPSLTGTVNLAAGGTVAKVWDAGLGITGLVRTGAAPDTAFVTSIAPLADAVITTKATTGLTFASVAAGGNTAANWQAIWK